MSDVKSTSAGQDRKRISLAQHCEVRDWTERFGVTERALRAAVARVGDSAEDVQRELGGRR